MGSVFAMLWGGLAIAASLSVAPTYFEFEGEPGQSVDQKIVVYNTSREGQRLKLYAGDFWYDRKFERAFPPAGKSPYSAASWVTLGMNEITVPASTNKEVSFVMAIPAGIHPSAYATIFIEQLPDSKAPREGVGVSLRIAVPLLFRSKLAKLDRIHIDSFSVRKPSRHRPLIAQFTLKNDGEAYTFPEGSLVVVRGEKREFVAKGDLKRDRVLLPRQRLKFDLPLSFAPLPGRYFGVLTIHFGPDASAVKNFELNLP